IGLTALQGVDDALRIAAGETVIIHGASGNVGMIALQFAKRRGARVLATASGSDGVELARRLGADEAIDGRGADLTAALEQFAPNGVDAVLAFVGGKELTRCLDVTKNGGRLAYPSGIEPNRESAAGSASGATTPNPACASSTISLPQSRSHGSRSQSPRRSRG